MYFLLIIRLLIAPFVYSEIAETPPDTFWCLPGQTFDYNCKYRCHCTDNQTVICEPRKESCVKASCSTPYIWVTEKSICRCDPKGYTICVYKEYQADMNGRPCAPNGSFFFDGCTYCFCVHGISNCSRSNCLSLSGACQPLHRNMHPCFSCTCTETLFWSCHVRHHCQILFGRE